jgi:hypothetical protein
MTLQIDQPSGPGAGNPAETAPGHRSEARLQNRYYGEDPRLKAPALATVMSLAPGLGQIYIGYYGLGFLHIVVVASIITFLAQDAGNATPFLSIFLAFFWLYNIVDAYRRAVLYNQVIEGIAPGEKLPAMGVPESSGSLLWGVVLIVAGAVALSHTRFGYSMEWLNRWWPVGLVLFGVYLIYKSYQTRRHENAS